LGLTRHRALAGRRQAWRPRTGPWTGPRAISARAA